MKTALIILLSFIAGGAVMFLAQSKEPTFYCVSQADADEYHMPFMRYASTTAVWATTDDGITVASICEEHPH